MHLEKLSDSTELLRNHLRTIFTFYETSWLDNWIRWTIRAEIIGNYNQTIKTRARGLRCSDTACAMFPQPATGDCVGGGGRERRVSWAEGSVWVRPRAPLHSPVPCQDTHIRDGHSQDLPPHHPLLPLTGTVHHPSRLSLSEIKESKQILHMYVLRKLPFLYKQYQLHLWRVNQILNLSFQ